MATMNRVHYNSVLFSHGKNPRQGHDDDNPLDDTMENYLMRQVCVLQFLFGFQNTDCFPILPAGVLLALRVEKDLTLLEPCASRGGCGHGGRVLN